MLFLVFGFIRIFATPQIPDKLIYKGDTISVALYLPDEFYQNETITFDSVEFVNRTLSVKLFGDKKTCKTTACGREYVATWEIIENQLYLTGIYSCCYYKDSIEADLDLLFSGKVNNGKVKADWVTTNAFFQVGKKIAYIDAELSIYENDFEFVFNEGKLLNIISYDNSKSRKSIYSQSQEKLKEFIYSNVNWNELPKLEEPIRIVLKFSANEIGKVDSVEVMRSNNETFNQEAIKVIKLIPDWDVLYFKGKLLRIPWIIPIILSEENKEKYRT